MEAVHPTRDSDPFRCPHCGADADQRWQELTWQGRRADGQIPDGRVGKCHRCEGYTVWIGGTMVHPGRSPAPRPVDGMPDDVRADFLEARRVLDESPRSAAALLRLAIEKLARAFAGEEHRSLYAVQDELVEEGRIDDRLAAALEAVRVTGSDSTLPGKLDERDDRETALLLFVLVNAMVELISAYERLLETDQQPEQ